MYCVNCIHKKDLQFCMIYGFELCFNCQKRKIFYDINLLETNEYRSDVYRYVIHVLYTYYISILLKIIYRQGRYHCTSYYVSPVVAHIKTQRTTYCKLILALRFSTSTKLRLRDLNHLVNILLQFKYFANLTV